MYLVILQKGKLSVEVKGNELYLEMKITGTKVGQELQGKKH